MAWSGLGELKQDDHTDQHSVVEQDFWSLLKADLGRDFFISFLSPAIPTTVNICQCNVVIPEYKKVLSLQPISHSLCIVVGWLNYCPSTQHFWCLCCPLAGFVAFPQLNMEKLLRQKDLAKKKVALNILGDLHFLLLRRTQSRRGCSWNSCTISGFSGSKNRKKSHANICPSEASKPNMQI